MLCFLVGFELFGAYQKNIPMEIEQPNGEKISCFASGDEFFNWYHDAEGYTIIQNVNDGYYYYAKKDGDNVVPSEYLVNKIDPEKYGFDKWVRISKSAYLEKKKEHSKYAKGTKAPHEGTLNNINIFIRFSDQSEFTTARSVFDARFNGSNSIKAYYDEVTYGMLDITTHHYPELDNMSTNLSYVDSHPRNYYRIYSASNPSGYQNHDEKTIREHTLIKNAINAIKEQIPESLDLDGDNDGFVDNVCFVVRGYNEGWNEILWAHRWGLFTYDVSINGKQVFDYTFQPEPQNEVNILCHEMFHALGAPDLYHYSDDYAPESVGIWDIMDGGHGHMGAYMKYRYSEQTWIPELPTISESGEYTLSSLLTSENNIYRINSPVTPSEYYVLEYRRKVSGTYESNLPGSGLLVYRINPSLEGNEAGPPDEVYLYRPGGVNPDVEGNLYSAYFSSNVNRTQINRTTNPSPFLSNNKYGGLEISNIGTAGETISFTVTIHDNLRLNGILTNADAEILPDMTVALFDKNADIENDAPLTTDTTNASGEYDVTLKISDYEADDYKVVVTGFGYQNYVETISLDEGDNELNIQLDNSDEYTLSGTIYDNANNPISILLKVFNSESNEEVLSIDSETGNYSFDLPAYAYYMKAIKSGYGTKRYDLNLSENTTLNVVLNKFSGESDFEEDNGALLSNDEVNGWQWGRDNSISGFDGDKLWGTKLNGIFPMSQRYTLVTPSFKVLEGGKISWYQRTNFVGYAGQVSDGGNVKISVDGGANYELLDDFTGSSEATYTGTILTYMSNPLAGEQSFSGSLNNWTKVELDLSEYVNETVKIAFDFGSSSLSYDSANGTGWYIDKLKLDNINKIEGIDAKYNLSQNYPKPFQSCNKYPILNSCDK